MKMSSKLNKKQATILEAKNIPGQCPENKDKINKPDKSLTVYASLRRL